MNDSVNYDESKVGNHSVPDVMRCKDGSRVEDAASWIIRRRPEILDLFASYVYGSTPVIDFDTSYEILSEDSSALGGVAIRKEIAIRITNKTNASVIVLALYLPKDARKPVPLFLGCNYNGNHAVDPDKKIPITQHWMRNTPDEKSVVNNRATEFSRGYESSRWPLEMIIKSGFGLATFYYGDVEADHPQGWQSGVRAHFSSHAAMGEFRAEDWGAIAAWAWGLSRAFDYLETNAEVDSEKIAVMGHSRLGKAALWAGALDERFALVVSNNSGAGGMALARRDFGESIKSINENFPHWFCGNYKTFNDFPEKLPIDMHQLAGLIAPRPLYIASAQEDLWADPKGEFLSLVGADPVYRLLGTSGLAITSQPPPDQLANGPLAYLLRTGVHDVTRTDWQAYIDFAAAQVSDVTPP